MRPITHTGGISQPSSRSEQERRAAEPFHLLLTLSGALSRGDLEAAAAIKSQLSQLGIEINNVSSLVREVTE